MATNESFMTAFDDPSPLAPFYMRIANDGKVYACMIADDGTKTDWLWANTWPDAITKLKSWIDDMGTANDIVKFISSLGTGFM